ncbi:hypothetical protein V6N12_036291 [Hibiscus sabdariffa]|uniref:Uncharacterized protein n=1 Tax=Hibiscus sabdariffa TaxID=183260 RepID=A0ABR2EQ80_9ROSI
MTGARSENVWKKTVVCPFTGKEHRNKQHQFNKTNSNSNGYSSRVVRDKGNSNATVSCIVSFKDIIVRHLQRVLYFVHGIHMALSHVQTQYE